MCAHAAVSSSGQVVAYYIVALHGDASLAGFAGAAYGAASVLSEAAFGRLGDRIDRRRLLTIGFAGASLAYLLQAFATTPQLYIAARFLVGLAAGMIPATLVAYVFDVKRPLGTFTSYNALGWLAGALFVSLAGLAPFTLLDKTFLGGKGVYPLLFIGSAAFCLIGWAFARRLPSMKVRIDVPRIPLATLKANVHVYASVFLRHLGASAVWITFPLYIRTLDGVHSDGEALVATGLLHVVNMVSQIILFRLSDRVDWLRSSRRLVIGGLALSGSAFIGYAVAKNAWQLIPSQVLIGVGFAALWLGSLREVLEHNVERATATGMLNASLSLSNVAGPLIGGLIVAAYGFPHVMGFGAVMTALGLVLFVALARRAGVRERIPELGPGPAGDVAP